MSKKILVIDDEALILIAVERALSKAGYIVSTAKNMRELDTAFKDAPFDMVITDLHMEEDTAENIIEKVKKTSPSVKVLKMSGTVNRDGSYNFLEKPFRIEELRKKVKDILNEPS